MGRGHGRLQQFILDELRSPGAPRLFPVPALAATYAQRNGVEDEPHLHASFRRAAHGLHRRGEVKGWHLPLQTRFDLDLTGRSKRNVLCIALPDADVSDDAAIDSVQTLMVVAAAGKK